MHHSDHLQVAWSRGECKQGSERAFLSPHNSNRALYGSCLVGQEVNDDREAGILRVVRGRALQGVVRLIVHSFMPKATN